MLRYAALVLLALTSVASAADTRRFEALSLVGEPKYKPGFTHLDYVNPQAPKGGELKLHSIGGFDNLNAFIIKGDPAPGVSLVYETLMEQTPDEMSTEYGLIASSVTERTRELGVRLALGASSRQILQDVVMPGLGLAVVGVIAGAAGALAGARVMQAYIWGVQPRDPLTLLMVVGTLLVVALTATVIPALRVLRLDPALTLRSE